MLVGAVVLGFASQTPRSVAGASITITPGTITAGGAFNLLASGFSAGESVIVSGPTSGTSVTADSGGNVSASGLRTAPDLTTASYTVVAIGQTSMSSALATVAVNGANPMLTLSSASVQSGATLTGTASGFETGESVCFSLSSTCVAADSSGGASQTLHVSPDQPAATYTVRAVGQSTLRRAFATLTVTPSTPALAATPNPAAPGQSVAATASGFLPNEQVSFDGGPFSNNGSAVVVAANGSGTAVRPFILPCTPNATSFTGVATGQQSGLLASTSLSVSSTLPTLTVSPNSSSANGTGTVSGAGWASGESVSINGPFSLSANPVTATGGSFSTGYTAFGAGGFQNGTYTVDAFGGTSLCDVRQSLALSGSTATGTVLTVSPNPVAPGQTVTITGGGFSTTPETVTIRLPFFSTSPTTTSDTSGNISTTAVVPAGAAAGTYRAAASGATRTDSAVLTISVPAGAPSGFNGSFVTASNPANEAAAATLTAGGFSPSSTVTFRMPGLSSSGATATAGSNGSASTSPTLSYGAYPGTYIITASQASNQVHGGARAPVNVQRSIQSISVGTMSALVRPKNVSTTVSAGSNMPISGSGFQPGETVNLNGPFCASNSSSCLTQDLGSTAVPVTADASGNFSASVFVPFFTRSGTHRARAAGQSSGLAASASVTVNGLNTTFSLSPSSASPGTTITASGSGFAASETVTISLPLQGSLTATTDSSGAFSLSFTLSSCVPNGTFAATASGGTSNLIKDTTLTVSGSSSSVPAGCNVSGTFPTATATAIAPTPTPTASSGGGGSTTPTTQTGGSTTTTGTSGAPVVTTSQTASASGGTQVIGQAAPGTGVSDLPSSIAIPNTFTPTAPNQAPAPPIDPSSFTANAPAAISASVSSATGGVIIAGNAAVIVPPAAIAAVAGGKATFDIKPATNVPVPGGPTQFSPNGTVIDVKISDANGNPVTTFPVPIPVELKYNAADLGQAKGDATTLTAAYVVDALTPDIANPLHFPQNTFVLFPADHTSLNTTTGTLTLTTQAIGSTISVVTNPVGYVQTLNPATPELSSFDTPNAQVFGTKPAFSYLQVVEPQIGTTLLVLDPDTGNYSYVNATDVGPSGPPPPKAASAVVRGVRPQRS